MCLHWTVLWEPRLHGTAMGVERVAGTEGLDSSVFGLYPCERQAGSGTECAEHVNLGAAALGVVHTSSGCSY